MGNALTGQVQNRLDATISDENPMNLSVILRFVA
jgi:hypothetical protein